MTFERWTTIGFLVANFLLVLSMIPVVKQLTQIVNYLKWIFEEVQAFRRDE